MKPCIDAVGAEGALVGYVDGLHSLGLVGSGVFRTVVPFVLRADRPGSEFAGGNAYAAADAELVIDRHDAVCSL